MRLWEWYIIFDEGDRKMKFTHQFISRQYVRVLNENGATKFAYVCEEAPKTAWLVDDKDIGEDE